MPDEVGECIAQLVSLRGETTNCQRCTLAQGRKNVVFGVGNVARPPVAFVGEAPGANEDEAGQPFVGRSGRVLDEFITWMGYAREQVYILNPVMCRPPGNRKPQDDELAACEPFFHEQLRLIRPQTIVTLGRVATSAVVGGQGGTLNALRGKWHDTEFGPARVTYHPAFVLRNPAARNDVYADLRAVRERLDAGSSSG